MFKPVPRHTLCTIFSLYGCFNKLFVFIQSRLDSYSVGRGQRRRRATLLQQVGRLRGED